MISANKRYSFAQWWHTHLLTLSTMKSIASAILESTGPLAKFPRTIFFSMKAGINQKLLSRNMETKH